MTISQIRKIPAYLPKPDERHRTRSTQLPKERREVKGIAGYGKRMPEIEEILKARFGWDGIWPLFKAKRQRRTLYKPYRYSTNSYEWRKVAEPAPGEVDLFSQLKDFDPFDIAKSAETVLIEVGLEMKKRITSIYGAAPIAYAGGLFNNVSLNFSLGVGLKEKPHFSMAPGDSGLATGGALLVANEIKKVRQRSPYIGVNICNGGS